MSTSTPGRDRDQRLFGGYPGRMLVGVSGGWALVGMGRYLLPPLLPVVIDDLALSLAAAGVTLTVLNGLSAALQFPGGEFSDRLGRPTLIVPGLAVAVVGLAAIAVARSFHALVLGTALFGVGFGLFSIPSRALLSDLFVEKRGRALGIFAASGDVGGMAASGIAAVVVAAAAWRLPFVLVAGAMVVLVLVYVRWNREPYAFEAPDLDLAATVRRIATTREQRETIVAFSLFYFVVHGVTNFLPTYLHQAKGLSPEAASAAFALIFVFGMAVKPVSGALSDRFSRTSVATGGLLLSVAALGALVVAGSIALVVAAIVGFAVGHKAEFPVLDAIVMDTAPDADMGSSLGAARALFFGVGSLGPAYVGVVAGRYGYAVAFAGFVACLLACVAIVARPGRRA